jgi:hypothetical protein
VQTSGSEGRVIGDSVVNHFALRQAARSPRPLLLLCLAVILCCLPGAGAEAAEPVTLTVHGWQVTISDNAVTMVKAGTVIPGPTPTPPGPQPTPPPGPVAPDLPEGQFGAARQAMAWAKEVTSANRVADCTAVAEACEAVAKQAAAGSLDGLISAMTAQNVANAFLAEITRRLGTEGQRPWLGFGDRMFGLVKTLFAAGRLASGKDWAVLLREVAAGVRAAQ